MRKERNWCGNERCTKRGKERKKERMLKVMSWSENKKKRSREIRAKKEKKREKERVVSKKDSMTNQNSLC